MDHDGTRELILNGFLSRTLSISFPSQRLESAFTCEDCWFTSSLLLRTPWLSLNKVAWHHPDISVCTFVDAEVAEASKSKVSTVWHSWQTVRTSLDKLTSPRHPQTTTVPTWRLTSSKGSFAITKLQIALCLEREKILNTGRIGRRKKQDGIRQKFKGLYIKILSWNIKHRSMEVVNSCIAYKSFVRSIWSKPPTRLR